ncbi:hypothetical protein ACGFX4_16035 [Kitasatospora sp. NPDC048365]|uniref:ATP-dependent DNA ligase n=1 Tax=Kitasatospora sp. NPDC048365 TaxID=3364050 RepID=UPI00370FDBBA
MISVSLDPGAGEREKLVVNQVEDVAPARAERRPELGLLDDTDAVGEHSVRVVAVRPVAGGAERPDDSQAPGPEARQVGEDLADALPAGVMYQPKADGIRAAAHVFEGRAVALVSRRATDLGVRFAQLLPPLAALSPGITRDCECVAFVPDPSDNGPGRFDFEELLRTTGNRAPHTAISLLAFDLLSVGTARCG